MKSILNYIKDTSFSDKVADVEMYIKLCRRARVARRKETDASLMLVQSYNYYEEDRYPTCISYVKANTEKGAVRGAQRCKNFSCDKVCEDTECPGQVAQAAYVAAHKCAENAQVVRDNFWSLMVDNCVKQQDK